MPVRFNAAQLKLIAMVTMFLDHAAVAMIYNPGLNVIHPLYANIGTAMRLIGRMAFPLYAFLLAEGFLCTKNRGRYLLRVTVFAVLSEIPYNLVAGNLMPGDGVFYPEFQNTMGLMVIGLLCMNGLELVRRLYPDRDTALQKLYSGALMVLIVMAGMLTAEVLRVDYGALGLLLILVCFRFRHQPVEFLMMGCGVLLLIYPPTAGGNAFAAWIAIFLINRYNGERGPKMGRLPYFFYPVHLMLLYGAGMAVSMFL